MKFDCIEKALKWLFYRHGGLVARHPIPFLLIPLVISAVLSIGLFTSFSKEIDSVVLYAPERTESTSNLAFLEKTYPASFDFDNMLPRHRTRWGEWAQVIITPKTGNNLFTVDKFSEVLRLHDTIVNVNVTIEDKSYGYRDFCIQWKNDCHEIDILALLNYTAENVLSTQLSYPIHSYPSGEIFFLGPQLGGVSLTADGHISSAEAILLTYNLIHSPRDTVEMVRQWEKQFLRDVENFQSDEVNVYRQEANSINLELDASSAVTIELIVIVSVVVVAFSVLAASSRDWVKTKPTLANLGVFTSGLALVSCFGLINFTSVPYANVAGTLPFLVMGIGVDDMFILISAWRQTSVYKSVEERTKECMEEAALSITITTLSDILAFGIGCTTNVYSVRIMCLYAAVAMFFAYVYMLTFFAACLVLIGHREEQNRHAITLRQVLPKKEAPNKAYFICCAGGTPKDVPAEEQKDEIMDTLLMTIFKKYYGPLVTHWFTMIVIILLYLGYLGLSIWGITTVSVGLDFSTIGPDGSYLNDYYAVDQIYFKAYGPDLSVVATEELSYWDPDVQAEIQRTLDAITDTEFALPNTTISWLAEYLTFLEFANITNPSKETFLDVLREQFLQIPVYEQFAPDIIFDSTNSSIISSRFYFIGKDVVSTDDIANFFVDARRECRDSELPLVTISGIVPLIIEQTLSMIPNTVTTLSAGIAGMFVISLLLIPHPVCAIIISLMLVSTIAGILGFMAHWSIPLDGTALVSLIIALGFGVDYSAHIAYAFVSSSAPTRRERAIHALYSLGAPTLQGAISTILAVSVLGGSFSYIYRTFCKTMTLVITIGAVHGLVFLPSFLIIFVPINSPCSKKSETKEKEDLPQADNPVFTMEDNAKEGDAKV